MYVEMDQPRTASSVLPALTVPRLLVGLALLLVAALGFLWWTEAPYGVGFGFDGTYYLSAAENLRNGRGYSTSITLGYSPTDINPLATWPPLYSSVLSSLVFLSLTDAVALLNLLLLVCSTLLVARAVYAATHTPVAALLAGAATLCSPSMFAIHSYALSEPLFTVLILLGCWCQERYLSTANGRFWLGTIVLAAAAALTRYVGVGVILAAVVVIGLGIRAPWTRRLLGAVVSGALASLPLLLWLLRNELTTGTLAGPRVPSAYTVAEFVHDVWSTFTDWFALSFSPPVISGGFVLLAALAVAYLLYRQQPVRQTARRPAWHLLPYGTFMVLFPLWILLSLLMIKNSPPDIRLMAPLLPVLLIVLISRLFAVPLRLPDLWTKLAWGVVLLALILFPALTVGRDAVYAKNKIGGLGYKAAKWRETDILQAAQHHSPPFGAGMKLYSNAADVLFLYSDQPTHYLFAPDSDQQSAASFYNAIKGTPSLIIFIHVNDTIQGQLPELAIRQSALFQEIGHFKDGSVYVPILPNRQ